MKACCNGCSAPSVAMPSMVVILAPSFITASVRQELIRRPSTSTVQAPHWPWSQPFLVPVRSRWSRNASSKVVHGATLRRRSTPLRTSDNAILSGTSMGCLGDRLLAGAICTSACLQSPASRYGSWRCVLPASPADTDNAAYTCNKRGRHIRGCRHQPLQLVAGQRAEFRMRLVDLGQQLRVLHGLVVGLAQNCNPLGRHFRRRQEGASDLLRADIEAHQLP